MKPSPPGRRPGGFFNGRTCAVAEGRRRAQSIVTSDEKRRKKFVKAPGKYLQSDREYGIILRHDCTRYAKMREVAALEAGNFRGVCPILNRATLILIKRRMHAFCGQAVRRGGGMKSG